MSETPKSPKDLNEFLAAPEGMSDAERERLEERRRHDDARRKRERWRKRKTKPTLEEILANIVEVAECPERNPNGYKRRSIDRRKYELEGDFLIEHVLEHGRFGHVKAMAKLVPTEGDRRLLAARTKSSLREHDQRYFDRWMAPHLNKFPDLVRETQQHKLGAWISDIHSLFGDPFTWLAFADFCDHAQPDVIAFGGDIHDGSEISTHDKPAGFTTGFQLECDVNRAMVTEIRRIAPRARLLYLPDNHFTDRVVRHLTQTDKALSGLRSMRIDRLLELDGLEVELVHRGSFLAPTGHESDVGRKTLWGQLQLTHGTKVGQHPAQAELMEWLDLSRPKGAQLHGISGHVHRLNTAIGPKSGIRQVGWTSAHCACIDEAALYYVKGNAPAWSRGFVIFEKGRKALQVNDVRTDFGEAFANGWSIEQKKKLPTGIEPVRRWWLRRYREDLKAYTAS